MVLPEEDLPAETEEEMDEQDSQLVRVYHDSRGTQSFKIDKLAEALSQAQSEIEGAEKSSKNEFIKYNYADLNSVITAIKQPFAKYGLSHSQLISVHPNGRETLVTRLMHKSGQWLASEVRIIPMVQQKAKGWVKSQDPQTRLGAITYMRRGALAAIAGVGQQDLDINKDEETVIKGEIQQPRMKKKEISPKSDENDPVVEEGKELFGGKEVATPKFKPVTKAQAMKLKKKVDSMTEEALNTFYGKIGHENVEDVPKKDFIKTMKEADKILGNNDIPF